MSDIKQLAEALVNLKVTEVACLAKILKEEYGIEPAATSLAAPVPEITELAKEKTSFNVALKSAGGSKLAVVKLVKELTGLGLKESKDLVDSAPKNIKQGISKDQAEAVKKQLEEIGAEAELN